MVQAGSVELGERLGRSSEQGAGDYNVVDSGPLMTSLASTLSAVVSGFHHHPRVFVVL